jgi:tetratricopeptide (TPR) repeat protein
VALDRPGRSREALLDYPGRSREAAEALAQAVAIFEQLAAKVPSSAYYRESLAMNRDRLANNFRDAGRYAEAEELFRLALANRKQLAAEFPGQPGYRESLAITLNNLAILLKNTERTSEAEELYSQSLAIHKRLAADFPGSPDNQNRVAAAMLNLGRLLLTRKDAHAARGLIEGALPYIQAALKANPRHPEYRNNYRLIRWRLAEALLQLKDHAGAAEAAGQFLQTAVEPPRDSSTAAYLLADCARLAAQDERLPEIKRQELAGNYGDRAMAALRQAIDKGAKEGSQLSKDPRLDPLRSRPDFQKVLAEMEAKSKLQSP